MVMHEKPWVIPIFLHVLPTKTQISLQSDQGLSCPHEETLPPWLSKMRPE